PATPTAIPPATMAITLRRRRTEIARVDIRNPLRFHSRRCGRRYDVSREGAHIALSPCISQFRRGGAVPEVAAARRARGARGWVLGERWVGCSGSQGVG